MENKVRETRGLSHVVLYPLLQLLQLAQLSVYSSTWFICLPCPKSFLAESLHGKSIHWPLRASHIEPYVAGGVSKNSGQIPL